ncbi:hypothetical protein GN956_G9365 [Arapaima gigas]
MICWSQVCYRLHFTLELKTLLSVKIHGNSTPCNHGGAPLRGIEEIVRVEKDGQKVSFSPTSLSPGFLMSARPSAVTCPLPRH